MVVADLFQLNKDYEHITYVTSQRGSRRQILDIDILELPDGMYWVKEGDFIITMGYFFTTSDVKFENFVRMLIRNKASGLGVKLGRFFDAIPDNALRLAEENNFPIINYPLHMSYKSMTRPVLNYLLDEEAYTNYTLKEYKKELNELVRDKYDIAKIMEHLKHYIDHDLFLMWENVSGFIYKTTESGTHEIKQLLEENRFNLVYCSDGKKYKCSNEEFWIYQTGGKEQILAFLCVLARKDRFLTDTDVAIIRETLPYLIIYLYSETRLGQYETRSKENFIMDILDGAYENKDTEMLEDARELKFILERERCFVGIPVKSMTAQETDRMYRKIGLYLDSYKFDYTLYVNSGCIYLLLALNKKYFSIKLLDRYFSDLLNDLRESLHNENICMCVSKIYSNLCDIHYAYEEIRYLLYGRKRMEKSVCYYEDYTMDHLLADIKNQSTVTHIYEEVIGKINAYDNKNKADVKNTLSVLIANDFNLTQAAEKMYLHRNTLYKRVKRVECLLGFDLDNPETRLMLQLVMKLDEIKNK